MVSLILIIRIMWSETKPDKINAVITMLREADNDDTQISSDEKLIQTTMWPYLPSSGCVTLTESLGM